MSNRTINKCKEISLDRIFHLFSDYISTRLQETFKKWKSYINYHKIIEISNNYCKVKSIEIFVNVFHSSIRKQLLKGWDPWLNGVKKQKDREYYNASKLINKMIRGFLIRLKNNNDNEKKRNKLENLHSIIIQNVIKKNFPQDEKLTKKQNFAADILKKYFKSRMNVRAAKIELQKRMKIKATIKIQRLYRGKKGRELYQVIKKLSENKKVLINEFEEERLDENEKSKNEGEEVKVEEAAAAAIAIAEKKKENKLRKNRMSAAIRTAVKDNQLEASLLVFEEQEKEREKEEEEKERGKESECENEKEGQGQLMEKENEKKRQNVSKDDEDEESVKFDGNISISDAMSNVEPVCTGVPLETYDNCEECVIHMDEIRGLKSVNMTGEKAKTEGDGVETTTEEDNTIENEGGYKIDNQNEDHNKSEIKNVGGCESRENEGDDKDDRTNEKEDEVKIGEINPSCLSQVNNNNNDSNFNNGGSNNSSNNNSRNGSGRFISEHQNDNSQEHNSNYDYDNNSRNGDNKIPISGPGSSAGTGHMIFGAMSEREQSAIAIAKKRAAQSEYYQQLKDVENNKSNNNNNNSIQNTRATLYRNREQKDHNDFITGGINRENNKQTISQNSNQQKDENEFDNYQQQQNYYNKNNSNRNSDSDSGPGSQYSQGYNYNETGSGSGPSSGINSSRRNYQDNSNNNESQRNESERGSHSQYTAQYNRRNENDSREHGNRNSNSNNNSNNNRDGNRDGDGDGGEGITPRYSERDSESEPEMRSESRSQKIRNRTSDNYDCKEGNDRSGYEGRGFDRESDRDQDRYQERVERKNTYSPSSGYSQSQSEPHGQHYHDKDPNSSNRRGSVNDTQGGGGYDDDESSQYDSERRRARLSSPETNQDFDNQLESHSRSQSGYESNNQYQNQNQNQNYGSDMQSNRRQQQQQGYLRQEEDSQESNGPRSYYPEKSESSTGR